MGLYDVVREDLDCFIAERELRAEDDRVQKLIDNVAETAVRHAAWTPADGTDERYGAAADAAEEELQQYIAKLRCDLIDERQRMLFLESRHEAKGGSVLVAMGVVALISMATGALVASVLFNQWICR